MIGRIIDLALAHRLPGALGALFLVIAGLWAVPAAATDDGRLASVQFPINSESKLREAASRMRERQP